MYQDNRPCEVCGAAIELRARTSPTRTEADDTVDERVCTNPECPSHRQR